MSNCIICTDKLKFVNTPTFGSGKLADGGVVCMKCFKLINKANPAFTSKLKKHTLAEVQDLLNSNFSDIKNINEQIKKLNIDNTSTFLGRKEISELPQILASNEVLDNIIQGTYNKGAGILVSTNRRLVFVDKGLVYGLKVEDFPLSKISSIQYETGLLMGKLIIHTSGNEAVIDNVEKNKVRKFAEFVRNKIENNSNSPTQSQKETKNEPDLLDKLEKLGKLKDSGILTDEEFNEQKAKLINR